MTPERRAEIKRRCLNENLYGHYRYDVRELLDELAAVEAARDEALEDANARMESLCWGIEEIEKVRAARDAAEQRVAALEKELAEVRGTAP